MKNNNVKKILAIFMVALALMSVFIPVLSVSAETQSIYPITINEPNRFDGAVLITFKNVNGGANYVVYTQDSEGGNPVQNYNGFSSTFINDNLADLSNFPDYRYGVMVMYIVTRNSSININGVDYESDFEAGSGLYSLYTLDYTPSVLSIGKSDNANTSLNASKVFLFEIHIPVNLDAETSYNQGYNNGYDDGRIDGESIGYDNGYNVGYDAGVEVGRNQNESSWLGHHLIYETLAAPINGLDAIVLYVGPNGMPVTLWGVFGTVIAALIFIYFLKRFAGG